ncbi:uncharacterized protein LOC142318411 isoform X2 [Lycorma delicatula]|uniref:uncharacterized protein LOC142318411 isoform X2 n=1 Tax=Lycorma delicatula TaxID=130591 RepID=UPI003F5127FD
MEEKTDIRAQVQKWREEREKRLLARVFRGRMNTYPPNSISAAVLGVKKPTNYNKNDVAENSDNENLSPIEPRKETTDDVFIAPKNKHSISDKRTTFCSTPNSKSKSSLSSSVDQMSAQLSAWASSKGKSLDSYRHLKCFISNIPPQTTCRTVLQSSSTSKKGPVSRYNFISSLNNTKGSNARNQNILNDITNHSTVQIINTIFETDETDNVVNDNDCKQVESKVSVDELLTSAPDSSSQSLLMPEPLIVNNSETLKTVTISALNELLSLIQSKYSWEACEDWLIAIRQRNPTVDSLPEYWECMAQLEETRGDLQLAVDSYERAVMRGAEVQHIDLCLDRMFEKLKELNINPKESEDISCNKVKRKKNNANLKDIFKSTVIKFALIQKKVKKFSSDVGVDAQSLNYVVTPVRRSTRYSSCRWGTPVKTAESTKLFLEDNSVQFKTNKALIL